MEAEAWKKVEELFWAAQAQPPDKYNEFLKQACPDDFQVLAEVQSLLDAAPSANSFLEGSPVSSFLPDRRILSPGQMLQGFEVLELMGAENASLGIDLDQPISFHLASSVPSDLSFKQELLAMRSDAERTERLLAFYNTMLPKLRRGVQASKVASGNGQVM